MCALLCLSLFGAACASNVPGAADPPTTSAEPSPTTAEPADPEAARAALEAAFADAVSGVDDAELLDLLERVKDNTIGFADPEDAVAAGYEASPNGCDPGAGHHYIRRDLVDDVTGTDTPEVLMYAIEETGPRLVGVEFFVLGTRLDPVPEILGQRARGPTQIPSVGSIYWQHVWLYDKPSEGLFSFFNLTVGCWRGG